MLNRNYFYVYSKCPWLRIAVVLSNELVKVERLEGKMDLLVDSQDDDDEDNQLMETDDSSSTGTNDQEKTTTGMPKFLRSFLLDASKHVGLGNAKIKNSRK